MLGIWAIMPVAASFAPENSYKLDLTEQYVAVYPSVWAGMKMMSPFWWVVSIVVAVVGGGFAGLKVYSNEAGQKLTPSVGICLLSTAICWFMMHSPATTQQDFTHKTIPVEEFSKEVAAKGGYDHFFKSFNQKDELYNSPAVFANPQ